MKITPNDFRKNQRVTNNDNDIIIKTNIIARNINRQLQDKSDSNN